MPSCVMIGGVALVGTDITEERIVSIVRVTRIGKQRVSVVWSTQRFPTAVDVSFLDQNSYCLFQVAPHLSSQGLS
jgi:hypothetical protein